MDRRHHRRRRYDGSRDHRKQSDEPHKKRRASSPSEKSADSYRQELARFLEEQCGVKNPDDFWRFRAKYEALRSSKPRADDDLDDDKLFNVNFQSGFGELHEKLPVLDKRGERLRVSRAEFSKLLHSIKVYQDFQQKTKFTKIKKLRAAQRELPIATYKGEIIEKLGGARVMLIAGDTGCGKSTQVPQYVLEAGYQKIVCTQPRRLACVSLAKRVSYETLTDFKSTVGYQIRFEKTKRKDTSVIFMTEGLLLRQASEEDTLNSYDVVILDEVHERHLHGDFLVGIMKCLLHRRDDFKLILMSATINLKLFADYFAEEAVVVVEVPGRLYPIELHYKPIVRDPYEKKRDGFDCTPYLQILQLIDERYPTNQKGDLLVFLNGFSEMSALADAVREYGERKNNSWVVLLLHSTLSLEEQDRVFDYPPEGVRKCIISTNIAETSVTIDGVRFVVDSGKVNRMSYVSEGGINRLTECNISQDSARQRAGRAGRTGPGVCFRLYSEEDYASFEAFTPAEIHLVPLESLLLHMISLGLGDISHFPFLEKPSDESVEESLEKLKSCGALSSDERDDDLSLTALGEKMGRLPVDLSIAKMLILSTVFGNVNSVLALAALLNVQSPYTQNAFRSAELQEARRHSESRHGDPITLLNLYKEWLLVKQRSGVEAKGRDNSKTWARKRGLEEQRFYEVTKLLEQFREILVDAELLPKIADAEFSSAERAIRYGELKQLKTMQYVLKNEAKSRRRKPLKLSETAAEAEGPDLRDVEFKITNDFKRLQKLLSESSADSHGDLTLLKVVLAGGLYPQVAVEDDFNSSKTVSEKLYHTKNKHYVSLRPTSVFATRPDILELHDDDVEIPPPGYFSRRPISRKHHVLFYQSILKTKKIYLVNAMRMPALQTLLLLARTIATNATLSRFVFDDFLSIDVPYVGQGKVLMSRALALRKKWRRKLESKLAAAGGSTDEDVFVEDLVTFMSSEVSYNIKRLLPADLKVIYNAGAAQDDVILNANNPFDPDFVMRENRSLGGVQVTENVVYDCLLQDEWDSALEQEMYGVEFRCPKCSSVSQGLSFFRMFQHEALCRSPDAAATDEDRPVAVTTTVKPNSREFHCDACGKDLVLTPTEILRHKKTCAT